jgi:hypothetical protein
MAACPAIFAKKIKRFAEAAGNHGFWKDEKYRCVAVSINNRRDIFFRWKSITGQSYWIRKNPKHTGQRRKISALQPMIVHASADD